MGSQPDDDVDFTQRESAEGKEIFEREHTISHLSLLDGLYGKKSTSNWVRPVNDLKVRRHFRVQWQEVETCELLKEYFFDGQTDLLQSWLATPGVKNILDYFDNAVPSILDTDEASMFFAGHPDHRPAEYARFIRAKVLTLIGEANMFQNPGVSARRHVSKTMSGGVLLWLKYLEYLIQLDQTRLPETAYVENIRRLMDCFGLVCMNGNVERLKFPETKLQCNPDLLFATLRTEEPNWAPLEAKHMILDPAFAKYRYLWTKPMQSNLKNSSGQAEEEVLDDSNSDSDAAVIIEQDVWPEDRPSGSKGKRAAEAGDSPPRKSKKVSFSSTEPDPANQKETVLLFLSQLLSQIVSLDHKYPSPNHRRIGIGVVGLRVIFVTFYGKPGVPILQVPRTDDAETEVRVTRPLSVVNATDRKEIAKALLAISEHESDCLRS